MKEIDGKTVLHDAATFITHLGIYIVGLGKRAYTAIKSAICDDKKTSGGTENSAA